jgi:hypothetical protein
MKPTDEDFATLGKIVAALHAEVIGLKSLVMGLNQGFLAFIDERFPDISQPMRDTILLAFQEYTKQFQTYSVISDELSREQIEGFLKRFSQRPPGNQAN